MPPDFVSIKPVSLEIVREQKLCYIDPQGTKHAMCWKLDDRTCGGWVTACGFRLFPRATAVYDGIASSNIDLRDIVMSHPSCIECIAASFTVET